MTRRARLSASHAAGLAVLLVAVIALATVRAAAQQTPRFRASVEVTSVDVTVVDDNGRPIANLGPPDFNVHIDGMERRVLTAEWVPLVTAAATTAPKAIVPEGYSSNENLTAGRLIVLAIDQPNIRPGGTQAIMTAAGAFIDKLSPADRVSVIGLGVGARTADTPFTRDRDRLKQALGRLVGQKRSDSFSGGRYSITSSEALEMARGDVITHDRVVNRECTSTGRRVGGAQAACRSEVEIEAADLARETTHGGDETVRGLRDLLAGLRAIDGPKTLMFVSEGFVTADQGAFLNELGAEAATARTTLYALQLDTRGAGADSNVSASSLNEDARDRRTGLELLAQAARGAMFTLNGSGAATFDRIQSEMTGYYLLGLETDPRDRDGKAHPIRIDVPKRGALVRARRQMLNVGAEGAVRSPRQAVAAALSSPLLASALPVRVVTFPLQGVDKGRVQLLIHADVGTDYSGPALVAIGYVITDATGRAVDGALTNARLSPVLNGVPSPLQFVAGANLAPGEYTLKVVAAAGDRVGSVEHPVRAALPTAGDVAFSELMAGGPPDTAERLAPTVGYTVSFGVLHGYFEAYGPQVEAVTAEYEIAVDAQAPPLLSASVPGRLAGDDRMIFTMAMAVGRLPPGRYLLRATAFAATKPIKTLTRAFEIAPPAVLLTSAEGTGTRPDVSLFLPVDEQAFARPFRRDEAVAPEALATFRDRVADSVKADFESGVSFLRNGDYPKAEAAFKRAIQPDVDSSAAMTYLAATFAASGHDLEAANAWQTALADGAELPQIYEWLSQALLRTRALPEARAILAEAISMWPSDPRFTGASASMDAIFGNGAAAVRTLERYVSARPDDDVQALRLGVEWIYQVHLAGSVIHTPTEDVQLAHAYANAYAKANGPQGALVRQWIDFLDKERR